MPLALLYLGLSAWTILMAILDRSVPPQLATLMRVVVWAGAIDGLYWLAVSPWGAEPPQPESGEKTTLSRILNPFALRAEAIARCDGRTWGLLALRLLMVCGIALVATRFLILAVFLVLVILALLQLLENYYIAVGILWALIFAFFTHLIFVPLASLTVIVVPILWVILRPDAKGTSHAVGAMSCALLGLLWEYQTFEHPPTLLAYLTHIIQTASNLQAMVPGLFLGSAASAVFAKLDPG